jgi:hypothetical protein
VGAFELTLQDDYSGLQGRVETGVSPLRVPVVVDSQGSCSFNQPPNLFCDPPCGATETCGEDGVCVETPVAVSAGVVSVEGLGQEVEMESSSPAFFYTFLGTLDHPPAQEGTHLVLHASGSEDVEPFDLDAYAITALEVAVDSVALNEGQALTVSWESAGEPSTTVHALLNIAQHGGNPGWIECDFPDDGQLEIPVSLTDQLLAQGFSGFPSLVLTRRSGDRVETGAGCVEWVTQSTKALAVEIEGLTSCSSDDDCTPPQTCQADLTCG